MTYRARLFSKSSVLAAVVAGGLAVAACASPPKLLIERPLGVIDLTTASTYSLSTSEAPTDAAVAASLRSALSSAGWREAPETTADWRLDALYAIRPATTGAYAGAEPSTADTVWLRSPAPHRWWRQDKQVRVLILSLIAPKTGVETARVSASLTAMPGKHAGDKRAGGAPDEAKTIAVLAAAALAPQGPAPRPAPRPTR